MIERGDAQLVSDVLERHLQRLEAGLADARHELDRIRSALALPPPGSCGPMSEVLSVFEVVKDLARAVDAVAFALPATGDDPDLEIILFELTDASSAATPRTDTGWHPAPSRLSYGRARRQRLSPWPLKASLTSAAFLTVTALSGWS